MTERERNDLARTLMPIAYKQTQLVSEQSKVSYDDLLGEAMMAIALAMRNGKPEQPGFYAYVKSYVRGYLFNYLRDSSRVVRLPRGISLAYLGEQRQLRANFVAYSAMTEKEKAELIGCTVNELQESRTAIAMTYAPLDLFDGETDAETKPVSCHAELVQQVFNEGISKVATLSRQPREQVEQAFYKSLREVLSNDRLNPDSL